MFLLYVCFFYTYCILMSNPRCKDEITYIYICTFIHVWYIDWFVIILISSNIINCSYFLHNLNLQPTKKFHLDACKSIWQASSCASWCAFYRSSRVACSHLESRCVECFLEPEKQKNEEKNVENPCVCVYQQNHEDFCWELPATVPARMYQRFRAVGLKMMVWKMIFLFNWVMFRFHVNLPACTIHGSYME